MSDKFVKYLVSVFFPAATLYVCWWLAVEVGEIVAVFAFVLLSAFQHLCTFLGVSVVFS